MDRLTATLSEEIDVSLFDMVLCLARAIDFLHPAISEHHLRAAYIASCLAEELSLGSETVQDVLIAGALHDLAAACSPAWSGLLDAVLTQDLSNHPLVPDELHKHGFEGYLMLRDFAPFSRAAHAIRFHHVNWDCGRGAEFAGEPTPLLSHILRVADHVAILPNDAQNILAQDGAIGEAVAAGSPHLFHPEVAKAFAGISSRESFWLDVMSRHKEVTLKRRFGIATVALDLEGLHRLSQVFGGYESSPTTL